MNDIIENSTKAIGRTHELIAAEINSIKNQTRKMMIYNSIEIGRRLVEAKQLVSHGEWGTWLEETVNYSKSTANNLMRIFEQYGADQLTLLEDNSKSQALGNLSYTQVVALLRIPEEDREEFIDNNDMDSMSTRELQQAIKDREKAIKEKEELEKKLKSSEEKVKAEKMHRDTIDESYKRLEEVNKGHYKKAEELRIELEEAKIKLSKAQSKEDKEEVERLQSTLSETESELTHRNRKIAELELIIKQRPIEVNAETIVEKIPEEIEKELNELRKKTQLANPTINKFSYTFEELVKKFKELLTTLEEIKEKDGESHSKYKNAVLGLISKMSETL